MDDDLLKKDFKENAKKSPEKHYPVKTLQELGFKRKTCNCGQVFWTLIDSKHCGEPSCSGGLTFIENTPAKKSLDYQQVWQEFSKIHEKLGYTPIKRYPVVARWNPTTEFTIASIAAFQPFVVSGEVKPPANPLVIPQFCLRFGDIDNVGLTGAHYTGFVMLGQHAFVEPKKYDINKYLKDHLEWLNKGMGLKNEDITIHEDVWAGGGNLGPCVEFFSRGLEISNQVYMQYEATNKGIQELKIKVLDMGQGQERASWFTQAKATAYETTFPKVLEKLRKQTKIKYDEKLMKNFMPVSQLLKSENDLEKGWQTASKILKTTTEKLKNEILPQAALCSIAEHTRSLLIAITDGALPSNVGGMYNLRVILRRALSLIDKYDWNVDLCDVAELHVEELKKQMPELKENIETVKKILEVEKLKYKTTKEKTNQIISKIAGKELRSEELITLYDSQGINPELISEEAKKQGKEVSIPSGFYALVAKRHEQKEQETQTERSEKIDFGKVENTKALYYDDWSKTEFKGKVVAVKDNFVVLDQTLFYPVSGGQMHDTGILNNEKVVDVFKQEGIIVHVLSEKTKIKKGDDVNGKIDAERRKQLTQHHTTTHIINAAARKVLGNHINQASAKKDVDKAYIDVTHYQTLTAEELRDIENCANEMVKNKINIEKTFLPRDEAEKLYGVRIYQGGAVPGHNIRVVHIKGIDVEACGGTHLNNTQEAEQIKILKTTKIKDGVIRIFYLAGKAAKTLEQQEQKLVDELQKELNCKTENEIPVEVERLFETWKKARKLAGKNQKIKIEELKVDVKTKQEKLANNEILNKTSETLQTQQEYIFKTVQRMKKELEEYKKQILAA